MSKLKKQKIEDKIIELKYRLLTDDKALKRLWNWIKRIKRIKNGEKETNQI